MGELVAGVWQRSGIERVLADGTLRGSSAAPLCRLRRGESVIGSRRPWRPLAHNGGARGSSSSIEESMVVRCVCITHCL